MPSWLYTVLMESPWLQLPALTLCGRKDFEEATGYWLPWTVIESEIDAYGQTHDRNSHAQRHFATTLINVWSCKSVFFSCQCCGHVNVVTLSQHVLQFLFSLAFNGLSCKLQLFCTLLVHVWERLSSTTASCLVCVAVAFVDSMIL